MSGHNKHACDHSEAETQTAKAWAQGAQEVGEWGNAKVALDWYVPGQQMVWLILGIGSSILVTVTGHQCWHVITAGSFFGLFWTELTFITKVVPNSYTSSSQASV